jgi:hypothetical protein
MAKKRSEADDPTQDPEVQSTEASRGAPWKLPKKGKPVEIPLPTKRDVLRDLKKIANPKADGQDAHES